MIKKSCCTRSIISLLLLIIISSQSVTIMNAKNNPTPNEQTTTLDETDKLALETFSNTVNCMFNIVHQPNNKQNVISQVGIIIGGIFNFVAQVVGHNKQTGNSYRAIDEQLQEVLQQYLKRNDCREVKEDFQAYLESLKELQEKIKHIIVANALHLREEK